MAHQEYEDLLTLQALDGLDPSEERRLADHLETCASCRGELAELRDAAGLLAHAAPRAEPGAEVRSRILEAVSHERKPGKIAFGVMPPRTLSAATQRVNLLRLAAVVVFAALLLGLFVLWQRDIRSRRDIDRLSRELNQQKTDLDRNREALARQQAALEVLNSPDMKRMELTGTQEAKTARATFVYDGVTGRAMIMTKGLPMAPSGMAYEVWFIPKGKAPMPGKTFTVDAGGHAMMPDQIPPEARDNMIIAITLEPQSGSAAPTGPIYLSSGAL
jgi:anti-sigma-K factor RskA